MIPPGSNPETWAFKEEGLDLQNDASYGGVGLIVQRLRAKGKKELKGLTVIIGHSDWIERRSCHDGSPSFGSSH